MMYGINVIWTERLRQIKEEGWTAEHDDKQPDGALSRAAACYALSASGFPQPAGLWPWSNSSKPKDPVQDLIRAGALIAAEIDRLLRKEIRDEEQKKGGA